MPKLKHKVRTEFVHTFRSDKVAGMFDVPIESIQEMEWDVDMPIEDEEWTIGLIVGPSGSGKTTLAKRIFGDDAYHEGFEWEGPQVVDNFPKGLDVTEITGALSHVGFSSPPAWCKPFQVLSNGQKFRAEMARLLLEPNKDLVVVDEFTSVVDRNAAKAGSEAIQKYIRKRGDKQFVAVSCHYDIIPWLRPDWIYQVDTGHFEWTRGKLRRPEITLKIRRVHHSAWRIFKGHHYLTADINTAAHCYVAFLSGDGFDGEEPVAFGAALYQPHKDAKNIWRGHRTVVLPDYQGMGIGNRLSEEIAKHYLSQGMRYRSTTSHPGLFFSRQKNPRWRLVRSPSQVAARGDSGKVTGQSVGRMTATFEYIGEQE